MLHLSLKIQSKYSHKVKLVYLPVNHPQRAHMITITNTTKTMVIPIASIQASKGSKHMKPAPIIIMPIHPIVLPSPFCFSSSDFPHMKI